jgi:hypothetical protein
MAFNPRTKRSDKTMAPITPIGGKPGVIITPLQLIDAEARSNQRIKKELKNIMPEMTNKPSVEYYMEWWKVGDNHKDIRCDNFNCRELKAFLKTFLTVERTVIYLERVKDGRVIRDARATLRG